MKKLHFFSVIISSILWANFLFAQENPSSLELEKLTRQKEYLRTRIYEIVRDNKLLEEKIKLFEGKANAYDEVVSKDQKTISELKVAFDQLEHDMKTLQEENNSLLNTLQDKENFIQNVQENMEKDMQVQKDQFLAELETKNQNLSTVQNQLKESQETSAHIHERDVALDEEQNKQINVEKDSLHHTVDELSQKKKDLEKQNANLITDQNEKKENIARLSMDKESLVAELVAQKEKYEALEKKFDQLAQLKESQEEEQNKQKIVENASLRHAVDQLSQEKKDLEGRYADLIGEENEKKENIARLSMDKESLAAELAAQKEKYEALEKKFDQLAQSGNRLTEGLNTLKARNRDLEAQNTGLMADKKIKEALISELTKNKESSMQELAGLGEKYKTLEEKFSRISQSAIKNDELLVKEVAKARKPLEELNSSLEKRAAELTAIVEKEGKSISELVEKKRDTEVVNRALMNENKKFSEKVVSLEAQLKSAQESFDAKLVEVKTPLDGKILFLEQKLKKMDADQELFGQTSKKNDQLQAELQTLQNENKKLNNDLAAVNDLLHETDEFLAKKVEEAAIEKDAEIKQLREKLGITQEQGKASDDVSLKGQ